MRQKYVSMKVVDSQQYKIIIQTSITPTTDELLVARRLAKYFNSDIEFIPRGAIRTPDFLVKKTGQRWELKTPRGNAKRTIQHQFDRGKKQSKYIILYLGLTAIREDKALREIRRQAGLHSAIQKILVLTKNKHFIEIKKKGA